MKFSRRIAITQQLRQQQVNKQNMPSAICTVGDRPSMHVQPTNVMLFQHVASYLFQSVPTTGNNSRGRVEKQRDPTVQSCTWLRLHKHLSQRQALSLVYPIANTQEKTVRTATALQQVAVNLFNIYINNIYVYIYIQYSMETIRYPPLKSNHWHLSMGAAPVQAAVSGSVVRAASALTLAWTKRRATV